ncbi:unnamed protein product [Moneuplotes crassus]|uniref:Major facilitator superfamily (MFS) profile domain-containing protein n=2 Tax=Euplotes crassus TaxID=5936 RepID=A0AAD1XDX1_EUPCR|nr:unnamed protein product [Moneuplotes crassus]
MDWVIFWLIIVNVMSQSSFSLMAPFYPSMAKDEKGVGSAVVGVLMASLSVSFVITSCIIGMVISKIGRRLVLYSGIFIGVGSMVGFGFMIWINNTVLFIILSFTLRLLTGVASAMICVAAYAMVSIKYPENVQSKIALLEAANGAGLFIGPIFGGLVYQYTHFCVPFFAFSGLFLVCVPFMMKSLGPELDRDDNTHNDAPKVGYFKLLKNKRVLFAGINQFWNMIVFCSGQPIFGPRLQDKYYFSAFAVGAMFAVPCIAYIIGGPVLLPLITKKFEPRTTKIVGFFILAICCFIIGPSKILGFPDTSIAMMSIGLVILGLGAAFTIIPIIPEMLDAVEGQFLDSRSEVSDKFSGIFNMAGGFGQICGPSTAGLLNDKVGFNMTFDIIALLLLAHVLIYMIVCDGFRSVGRSMKATCMRCRKSPGDVRSSTSTGRKLLEETTDEDEESITKNEESYDAGANASYASTDASFQNNDNAYAINTD